MANLSSIARPYALAAFDYARENNQIAEWKSFLMSAAMVTRNPSVQKMLANPEITAADISQLYEDVLSKVATPEQKNFLRLLAPKRRQIALPEMVEEFNKHFAAYEKIANARLVTAIPAPESFQESIAKALAKKTQREVKLHCEIDPEILGGAVIHIGDSVIDGSVRGKLNRLLEYILR